MSIRSITNAKNTKVGIRNKSQHPTRTILQRISWIYPEDGGAATYVYDSYGRPITVTTKSDVSTMAYNTRTESVSRTAIGESTPFFTSSKLLNSAGQLKTSTENGKAVSFSYFPTGLTKTSTPEGGQALSMEYNLQGKRKYLKDPDAGEVFSIYNGFGELTEEKQKVHNSQYIVTTNNYNDNGTLNTIVRNGETTQYSYNDTEHKSRPTSISIANKNTQVFGYDYYGRLESVNETIGDRGYYTYYGYDMYGRETSKQYPSYYLVSNTYDKYGNLTEVKDGNNRSIWKAVAENARGQITQERKGNYNSYYGFDERGMPQYISSDQGIGMSYNFDNKGNLQYRSDDLGNEESFIYDTHDRLTNWNVTAQWGNYSKNNSIDYNPTTGNIDSKTDIGTFKYGVINNEAGAVNPNPGPHALTSVTGALTALQPQALNVTYTDFKKIKTLSEGNKYYELSYGVDDQRRKSEYYANGLSQGTPTLTRYYLGDYEEEIDALGNIKQIHYLSGAIMIITITPSYDYEEHLYYTYADYQGSLIALVKAENGEIERYAYDPWGARRNPDNWTLTDTRTSWIVNRGYTGHEHLDAFGIINMNGRVYDPLTAMFFSPDPYVQAPGNWLNYNRYGYCFGNPMKYTDPSGNSWKSILTAVVSIGVGVGVGLLTGGLGLVAAGFIAGSSSGFVGGVLGTALNGGSLGDCLAAGTKGAIIGAYAGLAGGGAAQGMTNIIGSSTGGFFAGAAIGGAAGAAGGFAGGALGSWMNGGSFGEGLLSGLKGAGIGGIAGGLIGGTIKGIDAVVNGKANFWDGHVDLDLSNGYGASGLGKTLMKIIRATYTGHKFYGTNIYESSALGNVAESGGITLPEYGIVVGEGVYDAYLSTYSYRALIQHEYGHILQYKQLLSMNNGDVSVAIDKYYSEIGKPSFLNSVGSSSVEHANFSVEVNANVLSRNFFGSTYRYCSDFPLISMPIVTRFPIMPLIPL